MSTARGISLWGLLRHVVLLIAAAIVLLPFVWMIVTSLKPQSEIFLSEIRWWPERLHAVENYTKAFDRAPLVRFLLNGAIVTVTIFILQVMIALPAAYALAKLRFWGREAVFALVLFCILIPPQATAIPVFLLFHHIGILDTYAALIVPFTISAFGIFLMRQFFMTVPDDLVDAARMDGISEIGIVWRVMLPTALPALTAFGIFSIVAHWNDYFWPLIAVNSKELFTPPVGVATLPARAAAVHRGHHVHWDEITARTDGSASARCKLRSGDRQC
jgi:multiple sugar transport system permease protein